MKRSRDDFSMLAILVIPIAVAVNVVGGQLATVLKLPCYLDVIGTVFISMLCGPWVGAVAGGLTNIITGITNPVQFAFIPVGIATGWVTGYLAQKNMFSNIVKWIVSMIVMSVISIVVSAPIVVWVFGGVTGMGTSLVTATFMAAGTNIWKAVIGTEGIFTVLDRVISFAIGFAVIRVIPERTLIKFKCGACYIKKDKAQGGK